MVFSVFSIRIPREWGSHSIGFLHYRVYKFQSTKACILRKMVTYQEKESKTILNRMKVIDAWFWCRYTSTLIMDVNMHVFIATLVPIAIISRRILMKTIYVKINAPDLLEHQIKHSRTMEPDMVAIGVRAMLINPRKHNIKFHPAKILEVLLKYHYPVCFINKIRISYAWCGIYSKR